MRDQVCDNLALKRVRLAQCLAPLFSILTACRALSVALHAALGADPDRSSVQDGALAAILSGFAICTLCPWVLQVHSLAAWHTFFMVAGHIFSSPLVVGLDVDYLVLQRLTTPGTMALGFMCLRPGASCVLSRRAARERF